MVIDAVKSVVMNNFPSLVDIFLHYARPRQQQGMEAEGTELAVSMKQLATFVRTCRLSSETCSFFEIQRACVKPVRHTSGPGRCVVPYLSADWPHPVIRIVAYI
jgi:hypothetical protein